MSLGQVVVNGQNNKQVHSKTVTGSISMKCAKKPEGLFPFAVIAPLRMLHYLYLFKW